MPPLYQACSHGLHLLCVLGQYKYLQGKVRCSLLCHLIHQQDLSILILRSVSVRFSVQEMILLELLSKETSSYSRILFMLEKLMPANSLVSCSIFLRYLILGNWPNLCPTVGAWQRERDKERRKRFVGVRDSLCMCLHTYVSWHKAGLCGF